MAAGAFPLAQWLPSTGSSPFATLSPFMQTESHPKWFIARRTKLTLTPGLSLNVDPEPNKSSPKKTTVSATSVSRPRRVSKFNNPTSAKERKVQRERERMLREIETLERVFERDIASCIGCKGCGYIKCTLCRGTCMHAVGGNMFRSPNNSSQMERCPRCTGTGFVVCLMCGGLR